MNRRSLDERVTWRTHTTVYTLSPIEMVERLRAKRAALLAECVRISKEFTTVDQKLHDAYRLYPELRDMDNDTS